MTKNETVNYAIDHLMDNGSLTEVINGHAYSTYNNRTRIELEELYDKLAERGFVTAKSLATTYEKHLAQVKAEKAKPRNHFQVKRK